MHPSRVPKVLQPKLPPPPPPPKSEQQDSIITQSYLWTRIGKFLRPGDKLFVDGGTSHFGIIDADFPDITYVMQNHWASIGYALPAAFGGAMAKRDMLKSNNGSWNGVKGDANGRVVFITGEGAMQLTVQEVGTMVREKLDIIM